MELDLQLERGGSDGFRRPPVVWRVDEPFTTASLQRRFAADWAGWYGPVLRPHALAIAAQLARCDDARFGGHSVLPRWWALPVVRRRSRRLRIALPAPTPGAVAWWAPFAPGVTGTGAASCRLHLVLHQFWGAASDQALQPGPAVWCDCADRTDTPAITLPALGLPRAVHATSPDSPAESTRIEHRLHDGVGLLLLLPQLQRGDEAPPVLVAQIG